MKFKSVLLASLGLLAAQSCALAGSTINPNVPATNAPLISAPVRQNFSAAFNDINNLQTRSAANAQPNGLATFQDWANTTGCPTACAITMFDGTQPVKWGLLNQTTHVFTPNVGPGAIVGTAPITANISGGVATIGIANGTSIVNPGTGTIEAVLPIQTVSGTNKAFLTADLFKETRRSNAGAAMADTFPASTATGMVNGAKITLTNVDATASDTITGGSGTSISGTGIVPPGRAIQYVYDLASTIWRPTLNTATALLGPNNLSDLASAVTARSNLGLGALATVTPGTGVAAALANALNAANGLVGFSGNIGAATSTSFVIGAGSSITSSGPGGALGSNAFTSTGYLPLAGGAMSGPVTGMTALNGNTISAGTGTLSLGSFTETLGGNLTTAGALIQAGAFPTTITATATTNSTLPAGTHTLAIIDAGQTFAGANTFSSQIASTVATGTPPFSVASTTNVANLNAASLNGATFAAPGAIGSGTPAGGAFTTLSASGAVSGTGFSTYLASPPAIGGTAPAAGSFNGLTATASFTATGLVTYADMATAAVATSVQYIAGTSSTLVPSNVAYTSETALGTSGTLGASVNLDFSTFINGQGTLSANITTATVSNIKAGQAGQIRYIQPASGGPFTAVWPTAFKFTGGVTPSLSTAASAIDVLFYSCPTTALCYAGLNQNMK